MSKAKRKARVAEDLQARTRPAGSLDGEGKVILALLELLSSYAKDSTVPGEANQPIMILLEKFKKLERNAQAQQAPPRDISKNEIIRPRDLPQVTGLSRTTIWRLEKAGGFVEKIRLSNGVAIGYRRRDIERWLEDRVS